MPFFIGGLVVLGVVLWGAQAFVNADPKTLTRFVYWFALSLLGAGFVALLILLVTSDRLGPALVLLGFIAPLAMRGKAMLRRWAPVGGGSGHSSEVETEYLRMRLDHDTGAMSGTVRKGVHAGRRLNELSDLQLIELWRECRISDEASARLIESYLDRLRPDWREQAAGGAGAGAGGQNPGGRRATSDAMTREEALAILGLGPNADVDAIKKAHRELMMKLHPDQGGTTYLAAKINRAKEVLLG